MEQYAICERQNRCLAIMGGGPTAFCGSWPAIAAAHGRTTIALEALPEAHRVKHKQDSCNDIIDKQEARMSKKLCAGK